MIKLFVIIKNNRIASWSTIKMSEEEIEIELTEQEYQSLIKTLVDEPMTSVKLYCLIFNLNLPLDTFIL